MNYSFTQPSKKTLLKKVSRIWWGYIFLTLFIFAGFVAILKIQGYFMQQNAQISITKQKILLDEIKQHQEALIVEQEKVSFKEYITYQNSILKESIANPVNLCKKHFHCLASSSLLTETKLYQPLGSI